MKKNDFILMGAVLLIALLIMVIINTVIKKEGAVVVVTVDGSLYATLSLNEDTELVIRNGHSPAVNKLVIEDGYAYMKDADCPDKLCIHQGKINQTGEMIVCLPHRVVAEVKGKSSGMDGLVQ